MNPCKVLFVLQRQLFSFFETEAAENRDPFQSKGPELLFPLSVLPWHLSMVRLSIRIRSYYCFWYVAVCFHAGWNPRSELWSSILLLQTRITTDPQLAVLVRFSSHYPAILEGLAHDKPCWKEWIYLYVAPAMNHLIYSGEPRDTTQKTTITTWFNIYFINLNGMSRASTASFWWPL